MIESKEDYIRFLEEDKRALGITSKRPLPFINDVWKFERLLRKLEYYQNCKQKSLYFYYLKIKFRRMSVRLGFSIPLNVFDSGLNIAHYGTIIVNANAKIGKGCWIYPNTNIGANTEGPLDVPTIGDNVYIGPGAKIFGKITIADNISIGANSVVNKSFDTAGITVAGIPAKKISDHNSNEKIMKERMGE